MPFRIDVQKQPWLTVRIWENHIITVYFNKFNRREHGGIVVPVCCSFLGHSKLDQFAGSETLTSGNIYRLAT